MAVRAFRNVAAIAVSAVLGGTGRTLLVQLLLSPPAFPIPLRGEGFTAILSAVLFMTGLIGFLPFGALAAVIATPPWRLRAALLGAAAGWACGLADTLYIWRHSGCTTLAAQGKVYPDASWILSTPQAADLAGLLAGALLGALIVQRIAVRRQQRLRPEPVPEP